MAIFPSHCSLLCCIPTALEDLLAPHELLWRAATMGKKRLKAIPLQESNPAIASRGVQGCFNSYSCLVLLYMDQKTLKYVRFLLFCVWFIFRHCHSLCICIWYSFPLETGRVSCYVNQAGWVGIFPLTEKTIILLLFSKCYWHFQIHPFKLCL